MFDILFTEEDEVLTSAQTHFSDVFDVRQDDGDPERVVQASSWREEATLRSTQDLASIKKGISWSWRSLPSDTISHQPVSSVSEGSSWFYLWLLCT